MEKVPNGRLYPSEVIEGSAVTLVCDKEYRTAGEWQFKCEDGVIRGTSTDGSPLCVPIQEGQARY